MAPLGDDSFLQGMTRARRVQSGTLSSLTQLAGQRGTAIPRAPQQIPGLGDESAVSPEFPAGSNTQAPVSSTPPATVPNSATDPTLTNPLTSMMPTNIVSPTSFSDEQFYTRTGRMPSASDKLLMDARKKFYLERGQMPSPEELMYETQRGLLNEVDPTAPRIY